MQKISSSFYVAIGLTTLLGISQLRAQSVTMAGDEVGRLRNQINQNSQALQAISAQLQQQINAQNQQRLAVAHEEQIRREERAKANYYQLYLILKAKIPDLDQDAVSQRTSNEDLKKILVTYLRNSGADWGSAKASVEEMNFPNFRDALNYH